MKKSFKLVSLALAGAMTAGLFAACGEKEETEKTAASLVSVDVNPSVSFVLDEDKKVLSVVAENEDAQVLLYEEEFEGLTLEKATEKLAELAVELGYLHEGNRGVNITASGKVGVSEIQAFVEASFSAAVEKSGAEFSVNLTTDGLFSTQRELSEINAAYGLSLTVGEYELIVRAQAADKTLTVDAAASMTTEELLAIVYEGVEEYLPYATEAYEEAKNAAFGVYYEAKEELLQTYWCLPYLNVLKYPSLNGLVYGTYSASTVALETGIAAAELAVKAAKATRIPSSLTDELALALGITEEEEKAAFDEAIVGEDGKVTLASLEEYLDTYFKNMTADERAAAKEAFDAAMSEVKEAAELVNEALEEAYGDAIFDIVESLEEAIPDELAGLVDSKLSQFKETLSALQAATSGKEPLAAAYAALETLEKEKTELFAVMKTELEAGGDLAAVEEKIESAEETFAAFEKAMNDAIAQAESQARSYLANLKAQRQTEAQE